MLKKPERISDASWTSEELRQEMFEIILILPVYKAYIIGGMGQTDARTDIYCLGATLYHLVTGCNPSEPPYEIYPIRYWDESLSQGLEKIILKCTQADPDKRYQNCAEVLYDLEHYYELDENYRRKEKCWSKFKSR